MSKQTPNENQQEPRGNRFFGEDFKAWLRQGLAELREVTIAFPGQTPIAQPVQYGAIGQPPPSLVARNVKDQEQGFSIEELKHLGREIQSKQDNNQDHDRGHDDHDHGR